MSLPRGKLGSEGLETTRLGFGCMSLTKGFYGQSNAPTEEQATAVLHRALELGVQLFNTSDLYGPYINEQLVGKALDAAKGGITIATKWGPMFQDGAIRADFSPENCRRCCEGALQRLGVPAIDLFIMRGPMDESVVTIEQTAAELKALVAEGKVKYVGLSEVSADQIRRAHAVQPITAVELEWSLFTRDCEEDLVPTCRELGIGFLAYSPLGRGILTGKLKDTGGLDKADFRVNFAPRFAGDNMSKNLQLVANLEALAAKKGVTPGQLALAWLLHQGEDVFPIPGTRRVEFLEENVGAASIQLSPEEIQEIERAVPASEVAGDRYGDMVHGTYHGSKSH